FFQTITNSFYTILNGALSMLTEDENHILKRIERTIVSVKPKVKFTDICGLEKHIEQLQQAIA
ncbi:unnamed protein product, partial [Sphagnum compactum]